MQAKKIMHCIFLFLWDAFKIFHMHLNFILTSFWIQQWVLTDLLTERHGFLLHLEKGQVLLILCGFFISRKNSFPLKKDEKKNEIFVFWLINYLLVKLFFTKSVYFD